MMSHNDNGTGPGGYPPDDPDRRAELPPIGEPEPDFAEEHDDATLVGQQPGGPEGTDEDDGPDGLAGQD